MASSCPLYELPTRREMPHVGYNTHMSVPNKRPVRAVIYCRMSLAKYGDTAKVERQEKRCRALAKRLGWTVVHVYCDNNKSAWQRDRQRPDWDAMLAAIERGEVDAVIIYHGDRLIR